MMARTRGRKRKREFLASLNWSAVRTFELLRANIILILFAEGGESGKFCPHFAVVQKRAFPSSTDNDRNSRREARSFVRALDSPFPKNFVDYIIPRILKLRNWME